MARRSSRRLATYVYVDGVAYGPESDLPAEVAKVITNPKAWEDEADDAEKDEA